MDPHRLVEQWLAGMSSSRASGVFSVEAERHYEPALHHWITQYCTTWRDADGRPAQPGQRDAVYAFDPDLFTQPTALALHHWAPTYARAARSRDAAAAAVRSFYRWAEDQDLVEVGTHKALRFGPARFAAGAPCRKLWTVEQCRQLAQAADRYRGRDAERARAVTYLTLNHYLHHRHREHDILRPGQIAAMRMDGRRTEQQRTQWAVPQKNAASDATLLQELHPDAVRAVDEYLPHRRASSPDLGYLLTTTNGNPLDTGKGVIRILRTVAATHPDLAEHAPTLSADAIAHSPAPAPQRPEQATAHRSRLK
ncbi:hypothetical protein [Streptomyces sp. NPDC088360]|uniref:hypothetical protein n=1 Tax=Streptomyces sp. NPDC088360 TaxID=3154515 RepID=UPI003450EB0B